MKKFVDIQYAAETRKGGKIALQTLLPAVASDAQFSSLGDDRILAMMCKVINQAGFNWTVISNKWPQFEEAFFAFDPLHLSLLSAEQWEAYSKDTRVVRNWTKIQALMNNVTFVREISRKHGSFARFLTSWPASEQIHLMAFLKKNGSRLGGQTGQWFLRYIGKDGFVMTADVILAIQNAGYDIANQPTAKRDLLKVQAAFNTWHDETGLPYCHLAKIAAFSIGENYDNQYINQETRKFSSLI